MLHYYVSVSMIVHTRISEMNTYFTFWLIISSISFILQCGIQHSQCVLICFFSRFSVFHTCKNHIMVKFKDQFVIFSSRDDGYSGKSWEKRMHQQSAEKLVGKFITDSANYTQSNWHQQIVHHHGRRLTWAFQRQMLAHIHAC